ncbi:glutathione hydrolase 1 proenzyme-like isoform X1 [Tribolium madens]|uniref:glutathione hydrolase 1 proenzyme-like isoform X1 n=1 Tax=Tribolium madens TaxID=41895 RepID=UPI001CF744D8|nr:glutathione hydrolase 1 proenzyme-like isoform X1 [Tribolium madens]
MFKKLGKYLVLLLTAVLILSILATVIYFVFFHEKILRGAVVTNGGTCARIGASILAKGGTAVDAAIASLFCDGVSVPNCMGIGGGFFMNIYIKDKGVTEFLDAREVAPGAASENMFGSNQSLASRGGLAVAVPGELRGYWEAYRRHGGNVAWRELVQPAIDLCKNGILVTDYLEKMLESQIGVIAQDEFLREVFIDPKTNKTYVKNQYVRRPRLAKTLEIVAEYGPDALYNGALTGGFLQDIRNKGGIITAEDLITYKPQWKKPIQIKLPLNQTLFTPPPPGSGVILGLIMNILNGFLDFSQPKSITNWQRIVESFKFGFAKRTTLGDPNFVKMDEFVGNLTSKFFAEEMRKQISDSQTVQNQSYYGADVYQPEDHGTANLCVLAPNGDAVVVTSTINLDFGAGFVSESTGIILNNQMDDFSSPNFPNSYGVPPSPNNYIKPGKKPVSSILPSIILDSDANVRLLVGGSGGTKIITSVALAIVKHLWFNYTIEDAVVDPRLHHQLFPMKLFFEKEFENDLGFVNALHDLGHDYEILGPPRGFNTVTAISRTNDTVRAAFDPRRGGDKAFVE